MTATKHHIKALLPHLYRNAVIAFVRADNGRQMAGARRKVWAVWIIILCFLWVHLLW